jgi:hypothetical protein
MVVSFSAKAQLSVQEYKAQSKKISELVDERNAKFEEYQSSLAKKSGIFGGKTKKDLERSIELLTQTVEADNQILQETQALLNYKPTERTRSDTKLTNKSTTALRDSIAALRQNNLLLAERAMAVKKEKNNYTTVMLLLGLAGLVLLLSSLRKTK